MFVNMFTFWYKCVCDVRMSLSCTVCNWHEGPENEMCDRGTLPYTTLLFWGPELSCVAYFDFEFCFTMQISVQRQLHVKLRTLLEQWQRQWKVSWSSTCLFVCFVFGGGGGGGDPKVINSALTKTLSKTLSKLICSICFGNDVEILWDS